MTSPTILALAELLAEKHQDADKLRELLRLQKAAADRQTADALAVERSMRQLEARNRELEAEALKQGERATKLQAELADANKWNDFHESFGSLPELRGAEELRAMASAGKVRTLHEAAACVEAGLYPSGHLVFWRGGKAYLFGHSSALTVTKKSTRGISTKAPKRRAAK